MDNSELKKLAEAATPGRLHDRLDSCGGGLKYTCKGDDGSLVLSVDHKNETLGFLGPNAEADEAFFLKCTPAAVLALIAENERLAGFVVHRREQADQYDEALIKVADQRDQLKAENARLRSDYAALSTFNPDWDRVAAAQGSVREHMDLANQLKAECEESAAVIDSLAKILAGVAVVLKGEDLPLHRHGYHDLVERVTVLKLENDLREAECKGLRAALVECSDSLHGEMLQKFGGQLPDDMHPVTRREYDRDMAEVAGYRTEIGGIEPDLDTPELAGLRLDARRYRYSRDIAYSAITEEGHRIIVELPMPSCQASGAGEYLDMAIDAAMSKGDRS